MSGRTQPAGSVARQGIAGLLPWSPDISVAVVILALGVGIWGLGVPLWKSIVAATSQTWLASSPGIGSGRANPSNLLSLSPWLEVLAWTVAVIMSCFLFTLVVRVIHAGYGWNMSALRPDLHRLSPRTAVTRLCHMERILGIGSGILTGSAVLAVGAWLVWVNHESFFQIERDGEFAIESLQLGNRLLSGWLELAAISLGISLLVSLLRGLPQRMWVEKDLKEEQNREEQGRPRYRTSRSRTSFASTPRDDEATKVAAVHSRWSD